MEKTQLRTLFIGSKKLGFSCLEVIYSVDPKCLSGVVTIDDSSDKRSYFNEIKAFCFSNGVPLYVTVGKKHFNKIIKKIKPHQCFVVCWYWLIDKEILDIVPMGFLGIHNSLLPKYRGGSPLVWSIINGDECVGSTIFSITEGLDEGDIWSQVSIKLEFGYYVSDVLNILEDSVVQNFKNIVKNKVIPTPQNHDEATFCAQRIPSDGKIDFNKNNIQIYNFIRAQSFPYPGAFTIYKNNKLVVLKASPINIKCYGTPGQVFKINKEGVWVVCGNNDVIILKIVYFEEREVKANDVIKKFNERF